MLNKVSLIGRTGQDVQLHTFESGGMVGKVSLATTEKYTNRNGDKVESTQWHNLVFRDKGAENMEKYAKKGSLVYIEGKLNYRKYQDNQGVDKYITEILVFSFKFLQTNKESSGESPQASGAPVRTEPNSFVDGPKAGEDDDLPF